MGCSHNYIYTQEYFVCTKCGKRSYGRKHKKQQGKIMYEYELPTKRLLNRHQAVRRTRR